MLWNPADVLHSLFIERSDPAGSQPVFCCQKRQMVNDNREIYRVAHLAAFHNMVISFRAADKNTWRRFAPRLLNRLCGKRLYLSAIGNRYKPPLLTVACRRRQAGGIDQF
jgi:hypothetical protein